MSEQILWFSSGVPLSANGEKWGKNALSTEQRRNAQHIRMDFGKWALRTGRAKRCGGHAPVRVYGGIGMSFHNGTCCQDFMYKWRVPPSQAFKDYIATGDVGREGIEAQAEFALRLYRRFKADCKPHSKNGVNKASVAKYRAYRQQWVDFLKYWEEISG